MALPSSSPSSTQGHIFMRVSSSSSCLGISCWRWRWASREQGWQHEAGGRQGETGWQQARGECERNVQWQLEFTMAALVLLLLPFHSSLARCLRPCPFPLTTPLRCCCCLSVPYIKYPASLCGASCGAHTLTGPPLATYDVDFVAVSQQQQSKYIPLPSHPPLPFPARHFVYCFCHTQEKPLPGACSKLFCQDLCNVLLEIHHVRVCVLALLRSASHSPSLPLTLLCLRTLKNKFRA